MRAEIVRRLRGHADELRARQRQDLSASIDTFETRVREAEACIRIVEETA